MSRILLFVHYNKYGLLLDYVIYALQELRPFFNKIVFISNSPISGSDLDRLSPCITEFIQTETRLHDFCVYKNALLNISDSELRSCASLVLMNDTCFGPLFNMKSIFSMMESGDCDFWGMAPGSVRSDFISFSNNVVKSDAFTLFWKGVDHQDDRNSANQRYEAQLELMLRSAGFIYDVYPGKHADSVALEPDVLIKTGVPFIKIDNITNHSHPKYLTDLIVRYSHYRSELIHDYFFHNVLPDQSIMICDKNLIIDTNPPVIKKSGLKVAICFHVYYVDVFKEYITWMLKDEYQIDLFITTDTQEKKKDIHDILNGMSGGIRVRADVSIFPNKGRDVLPWLAIQEKIGNYDVVGKFHTKKSAANTNWIGNSWMFEIFKSIGSNIPAVVNAFAENPRLGIVIPDYPYYLRRSNATLWQSNKKVFANLLLRLNLKKRIDVSRIREPIMPVGNMFWYRPESLKPLFDLGLNSDDFPVEPMKSDGTIAHGIERLPVYIAWSEGFDFRVAISRDNVYNGFSSKELYVQSRSIRERIRSAGKIFPSEVVRVVKRILKF